MANRSNPSTTNYTDEEWAVLLKAAKRKGLPTATYIRFAVMPIARKDAKGDQ